MVLIKLLSLLLLLLFSCVIMGMPVPPFEPCQEVICPHFLDPVCGIFETELISFPNQCEFENETCKLKKQGRMVRLGSCPDWHVFAR